MSSPRVLLLGGTSEIGLAIVRSLSLPSSAEVILAGRSLSRLADAGASLGCTVQTESFDAVAVDTHQAFVDKIFASGPVDLVIAATGVLSPQEALDKDVAAAATMIETNFTSHITTLLATAGHMRAQGRGTIVILSSVAAIRPRRFNPVYGASKAGLDAFAHGLTDSLHGSGVSVLLVRPGFVIGRMTAGNGCRANGDDSGRGGCRRRCRVVPVVRAPEVRGVGARGPSRLRDRPETSPPSHLAPHLPLTALAPRPRPASRPVPESHCAAPRAPRPVLRAHGGQIGYFGIRDRPLH
jgi:decaprenylphospho-beta-D-erythro-pentofuranosid-2-ulose 2-reductase